eukprot:gene6440-biopygen8920
MARGGQARPGQAPESPTPTKIASEAQRIVHSIPLQNPFPANIRAEEGVNVRKKPRTSAQVKRVGGRRRAVRDMPVSLAVKAKEYDVDACNLQEQGYEQKTNRQLMADDQRHICIEWGKLQIAEQCRHQTKAQHMTKTVTNINSSVLFERIFSNVPRTFGAVLLNIPVPSPCTTFCSLPSPLHRLPNSPISDQMPSNHTEPPQDPRPTFDRFELSFSATQKNGGGGDMLTKKCTLYGNCLVSINAMDSLLRAVRFVATHWAQWCWGVSRLRGDSGTASLHLHFHQRRWPGGCCTSTRGALLDRPMWVRSGRLPASCELPRPADSPAAKECEPLFAHVHLVWCGGGCSVGHPPAPPNSAAGAAAGAAASSASGEGGGQTAEMEGTRACPWLVRTCAAEPDLPICRVHTEEVAAEGAVRQRRPPLTRAVGGAGAVSAAGGPWSRWAGRGHRAEEALGRRWAGRAQGGGGGVCFLSLFTA